MSLPEEPKEGFEEVIKRSGEEIKGPFYCSFCGKSNKEVRNLILGVKFCSCKEGGAAFSAICEECAQLTIELLIEENDKGVNSWLKNLASMLPSSQT